MPEAVTTSTIMPSLEQACNTTGTRGLAHGYEPIAVDLPYQMAHALTAHTVGVCYLLCLTRAPPQFLFAVLDLLRGTASMGTLLAHLEAAGGCRGAIVQTCVWKMPKRWQQEGGKRQGTRVVCGGCCWLSYD